MSDKKYEKPAKPFELWNIENYETVYWQEREDEYFTFMLKLYQAPPLTEFRYLYGRKGDRFAIQVTRKRLLDIHNSKDLMER